MTRREWHDLVERAREVSEETDMDLEDAILLEIERADYKLVKA